MSIDEQTIYIEALALGMERGFHMLFAELHSEKSSSIEAYRTCGFLYWNRRFLLAYENMLRSLGARYACVTIPYWDYFADYAKFIGNKCDSFQSCSTILAGIGGSKGVPKSVTINGRTFTDNCVTQFPFSSFCESSSIIDKSLCAGCVPRAELTSKPFPSGLGYAGLGVMLGKAKGLRDFNNNILFGVHNSIHSALGSTMASIVAPADPLFFSHHATIDMLHQMYLECQVGDSYLSDTSLGVQRFVFQKCSIAGETCPDTSSPVTQLWATAAAPADTIPAEVHSSLKQFFSNLPTKYSNWASTSALGVNSYDYERDDLLTNLQKYGFVCPSQAFTVQSILTSTRSEKSAEATPNEKRALQFIDFGRQPIVATPKSPPPPNPPAMADGFGTISGPLPSLPVDPDRDFIQALSIDFLDSALLAARAIDGTLETAFLQVELMECAFYDRFFRVDDLTKEFRDSFGLGDDTHTRCTTLKTQLANGEAAILVDDWISYFQQLVRG
ncbi:TPA: hypothetical protein N0F65_002465 [Lagenidium giganteum]|uniref:Tyrosinase copper-binding domain-containing protein n=1 Tax=Lagenidium giganteum TaxID=4803 RepID=A0AAV2YQR1_9STRA|nr:TPA: hypothetical protein N0F65_002465 [Lagenidium giganteum]